jgi:single-strand DNA-binding protein
MINKQTIVGYVGGDPRITTTASGTIVAHITVATTESWKDKNAGEKKEETEWHRVAAFDRLAETVRDMVRKGSLVYVDGRTKTSEWRDKDGISKSAKDVIATTIRVLKDGKAAAEKSNNNQPNGRSNAARDEDIPF